MFDLSYLVISENGKILYSGKDREKMDEALTNDGASYLFVREKNHLSLIHMDSFNSIYFNNESAIQALKGLL